MKWILRIVYLAVFVISMACIMSGQRNIGPAGLLIMMVGLVGILALMWLYNKKYQ